MRVTLAQGERVATVVNLLDIGTAFNVYGNGAVTVAQGTQVPEVLHSDDHDVDVMNPTGTTWHAVTGLTGQHAYSGAVMHPSETFGASIGALLIDLAREANPSDPDAGCLTVATVVVDVLADDDDPEPAAAGWAIVVRTATNLEA